jgi:transcriptional antiterminator RfaH
MRKTVRHARKVRCIFAPLFPNYLFIRLDITGDLWRSVNGTRGVIRLIAQDETPQPVPTGIVESLQARMSEDGSMNWALSLKIGQVVRISHGPFADFVGTLERLDAADRVRVLLNMLGRSVFVVLHSKALIPVA